jgi:hypothetical protein
MFIHVLPFTELHVFSDEKRQIKRFLGRFLIDFLKTLLYYCYLFTFDCYL